VLVKKNLYTLSLIIKDIVKITTSHIFSETWYNRLLLYHRAMLSKENQSDTIAKESEKTASELTSLSLHLPLLMEELTQSYTSIKNNDSHVDTYSHFDLNEKENGNIQADSDSITLALSLSLNQYETLKKQKEFFLNKCAALYGKIVRRIFMLPALWMGFLGFTAVHHHDVIHYHNISPACLLSEVTLGFIDFALVMFVVSIVSICSTPPTWFKKRWLKKKVDEEKIFETYKEKLYVMFKNQQFQNNYFAHTRLHIAQLESQIEKTKIPATSELKKILGKAIQCQTKLCISFVDGDAQDIHAQILEMEGCFSEWKALNANDANFCSAKVSGFLKQHEEFMKSSGLNHLLDKISEPEEANHVVKAML
jgi:hypothetical protein